MVAVSVITIYLCVNNPLARTASYVSLPRALPSTELSLQKASGNVE